MKVGGVIALVNRYDHDNGLHLISGVNIRISHLRIFTGDPKPMGCPWFDEYRVVTSTVTLTASIGFASSHKHQTFRPICRHAEAL